jgi:bifunctional non-homologous end joining protein LigD
MQVYAPLVPVSSDRTSAYAHELAKRLEKAHPDLVVSRMAKDLRPGKVFVDWSQNSAAKTTVAPYSLRARPNHWVSTPLTWDEVQACGAPTDLQFRADDVLARVEEHGDLFAPLLDKGSPLP